MCRSKIVIPSLFAAKKFVGMITCGKHAFKAFISVVISVDER